MLAHVEVPTSLPVRVPPPYPLVPYSLEDEIAALEGYKRGLEEEKASIEQEIKDVEARIKELKSILERGRPPGAWAWAH